MEERPSKSERKRRSDDLQSLGEALIDLPDSEFNALPLPEQLREAVQLARKIVPLRQLGDPLERHHADPRTAQGMPVRRTPACAL